MGDSGGIEEIEEATEAEAAGAEAEGEVAGAAEEEVMRRKGGCP